MILIHSNYHPDNIGGIESVVKQLMQIAHNQGEAVEVVCAGDSSQSFAHAFGMIYTRRTIKNLFGAPIISFGNIFFTWRGVKADLIIYQEPFPTLWPAIIFLNYILKKNIIVLHHADPAANSKIKYLYKRFRSFVFRNCISVSTSPELENQVKSPYHAKSVVIPLGIERDYKLNLNISDISELIPIRYCLFVGRLAEYKGIPYLLDAIHLLPSINFIIAGSGPYSDFVEEFLREKQVSNLIFINQFISEAEKLTLIENCQILLFPSVSENEAFGIIQLEAMRQRKPIINTFLDNGVNYVAPNGVCSVSVEKCNSKSLANAIDILWHDECLRLKLGEMGKNRFLDLFTVDHFTCSWTQLINFMLEDDT